MFSTLNKLSETSENVAFGLLLLQEMENKNLLFFFLLQCVINVAMFDKDATFSRSEYFKTLENKQLLGHVVKRFESPTLISCSHSCLRNTWCTSTNFKLFSEKNNKGTCELNKYSISPLDVQSTELNDQQGVIFSMFFKVMYHKLIKFHPSIFFLKFNRFPSLVTPSNNKYCLWPVQNHVKRHCSITNKGI